MKKTSDYIKSRNNYSKIIQSVVTFYTRSAGFRANVQDFTSKVINNVIT